MSYTRHGTIQDGAAREAGVVPCKDCPDRHEACAGHCEKYKTWKATYLSYKKKFAEMDAGEKMAVSARMESFHRINDARRRRSKRD